ncbi:MAG TPA: DUF1028 domain-containing protein [Hyphomicrobiaceae bacterium]|nr:DUF1028 domain-containing protein [Hyphomicrobiaceae bacterium]
MTWSIIAREEETGRVGLIISADALACGPYMCRIATGVGAVASQGLINPLLGPQALALLKAGAHPEEAVRLLVTADEGRDLRQLHIMDARGHAAAHTGTACTPWCGHEIRDALSLAGDGLAGPEVIAAAVEAYGDKDGRPLAQRLIAAMQAGEKAAGNGTNRSAALLIHDQEEYPLLDLRVDDHADPLTELARLEAVARERWIHFRRVLPSEGRPYGFTDRARIEEEVAKSIAAGYH